MEKGEMGENATGRLATYYVAECMEFNRYGEYREDIQSAEEAVKVSKQQRSQHGGIEPLILYRSMQEKGLGFMWRRKMVFHWTFHWFPAAS